MWASGRAPAIDGMYTDTGIHGNADGPRFGVRPQFEGLKSYGGPRFGTKYKHTNTHTSLSTFDELVYRECEKYQ